jgi:hypothetical protein
LIFAKKLCQQRGICQILSRRLRIFQTLRSSKHSLRTTWIHNWWVPNISQTLTLSKTLKWSHKSYSKIWFGFTFYWTKTTTVSANKFSRLYWSFLCQKKPLNLTRKCRQSVN